jgi:hypothetical protein
MMKSLPGQRRHVAVAVAVAVASIAAAAPAATADVGTGPPVLIHFKPAVLDPVIHGTAVADVGGPYSYVAKGYFKIGTRTVARLRSFSGTATTTTTTSVLVRVTTTERKAIRAAARHTGHKRTTLTIAYTLTYLPPQAAATVHYSDDVFLTIPKN